MKINQKLINFYNSTHYIFEELNICIKINEICPQLENLLEKHAIDQWAFITAFNPYSKELNENENYTRHLNLIKDVDTFLYFEGIGKGLDVSWEPEKSLLILGITEIQAMKLCIKYEQNAIVIGNIGKPAQLIFNENLN